MSLFVHCLMLSAHLFILSCIYLFTISYLQFFSSLKYMQSLQLNKLSYCCLVSMVYIRRFRLSGTFLCYCVRRMRFTTMYGILRHCLSKRWIACMPDLGWRFPTAAYRWVTNDLQRDFNIAVDTAVIVLISKIGCMHVLYVVSWLL